MTRIKTTLALLLGLMTLAATAPAASAATVPNPLRSAKPKAVEVANVAPNPTGCGRSRESVNLNQVAPSPKRWVVAPELRAKAVLPPPAKLS